MYAVNYVCNINDFLNVVVIWDLGTLSFYKREIQCRNIQGNFKDKQKNLLIINHLEGSA